MLPFLKPNRSPAVIVKQFKTSESKPEDSSQSGLLAAAEDLCKGIELKDYSAIAAAFKAAFEILESQPHEEAPHSDEQESE